MSHAVIASSGSKSAGGERKGSIHNGKPLERKGVHILTSIVEINFFIRSTSPPCSAKSCSSIAKASLAKSPCGSRISAGIPAKAASSITDFAITVFPEPVEPNIAACLARTILSIWMISPLSLLSPNSIPLALIFFLREGFGFSKISSTRSLNS